MKVLHINQSDIAGGAAIVGYRLYQGLLNQGIDSRLLIVKRSPKNEQLRSHQNVGPLLQRLGQLSR